MQMIFWGITLFGRILAQRVPKQGFSGPIKSQCMERFWFFTWGYYSMRAWNWTKTLKVIKVTCINQQIYNSLKT